MLEHTRGGRILRRKEVERRIGLSRSSIYESIALGLFPKPVRIGRRAVGWPEDVINKWLDDRVSRSGAEYGLRRIAR